MPKAADVEFFLIRHGETDWNVAHRFQGHTDIPLNAAGRLQAARLTERLPALELDLLVSSDLSRARETAEIANRQLGLQLEICANLREAHLGQAEGLLRDEILARYGEERWTRWQSVRPEDMDIGYPGGETKAQQLARCLSSLEAVLARHPTAKRIAVFTHGGCVRRLVHSAEGAPALSVPLPNACIHRVLHLRESGARRYLGEI
jgi:probable phosphoglycerate mutase